MSIGEMPQTIDFENNSLTLILGENLDMVTETQSVARNGAGKTAIFNALSYALFGQALNNIRKENLINNMNNKGMFVVFEFSKDGHNYRIERGRRPNFFKFLVDNNEVNAVDTDEAQGESKLTQEELERVIGMSHNMFKHIIALNTKTIPFLELGAKQQRDFIEELLGMRMLSEKAETLKELVKVTKEEIKMEEFRVKTVQEGNKKIEKNIEEMRRKSATWDSDTAKKIQDLESASDELSHIDIEVELTKHKNLKEFLELEQQIERLKKEHKRTDREAKSLAAILEKNSKSLETAIDHKCPTCDQEIHDGSHDHIMEDLARAIESDTPKLDKLNTELSENITNTTALEQKLATLGSKPKPYYRDIDEAYNHKTSVEVVMNELNNIKEQENPYNEQILSLEKTGMQDIDFESLNELVKMRDHQEFLLKLLTSNDSFIRKKIIDQNIAFLNDRLSKYLEKLGLPHMVLFQSDLTVQITNFGRELDFDNLSRGEQTRLILGLCWSFRDIYELMVGPVNVVLIDELLDIGSDQQLVESAMGVIKKMNQDRAKDVFVISHKEELVSKIPQVLKVVKEGGFSVFNFENDYAF
jgi:DNA repair exonuclease SbcCD ATPase subunit